MLKKSWSKSYIIKTSYKFCMVYLQVGQNVSMGWNWPADRTLATPVVDEAFCISRIVPTLIGVGHPQEWVLSSFALMNEKIVSCSS